MKTIKINCNQVKQELKIILLKKPGDENKINKVFGSKQQEHEES
jgi:hypothetical protein